VTRAHWTVLLCALSASACGEETGEIIVDLRTDYVPGVEFTAVRSEVVGATVTPVITSAFATDDFIEGELVAELTGVPFGGQQVRVTLIGPSGTPLDERTERVDVAGRVPATFYIPRRDTDCGADSDCVFSAACGAGRCVESACLFTPNDGACAPDEYCDPDEGCLVRPDPPDAGPDGAVDAGPDTSVVDATPDTTPDAVADTGPPIDLTSGLAAHWECDSIMDGTIADSSGNGHVGTCPAARCPTATSGRIGSALHFSGNEYVVVPHHSDFAPAELTLSAWVRDSGGSSNVVSKILGPASLNSWQVFIDSELVSSFRTATTPAGEHRVGRMAVTMDGWTHVAAVFDGAIKVTYVDGVLDEAAAPGSGLEYDDGDVYIGADLNGGSTVVYLVGDLDDIRFYRRALSAAEIAALASP
jgi:hypothetical protein